jgi:hypothetical protein
MLPKQAGLAYTAILDYRQNSGPSSKGADTAYFISNAINLLPILLENVVRTENLAGEKSSYQIIFLLYLH